MTVSTRHFLATRFLYFLQRINVHARSQSFFFFFTIHNRIAVCFVKTTVDLVPAISTTPKNMKFRLCTLFYTLAERIGQRCNCACANIIASAYLNPVCSLFFFRFLAWIHMFGHRKSGHLKVLLSESTIGRDALQPFCKTRQSAARSGQLQI